MAVANFLWRLNPGTAVARSLFAVEVWQHVRGEWQLLTRYAAPANDMRPGVRARCSKYL